MRPAWIAGGHRVLIAAVVTGVLALSGAAGITFVALDQHHAPEPPLTAAATVPTPSSAPTPTSGIVGPILQASPPVSITIPAIGVQSNLLTLGRTAGGALAVPALGISYNLPGWYRYSPTPGALGPAVIAGHVDSAEAGPAVFYRLGALKPGDSVTVLRADGRLATFRVDAVRRYSKHAFPTTLVYGNTNHAALRLITCGGPFDSATGSYEDNIIVWASLKSATAAKPAPAASAQP
jgi:sortase (surface protein transpeptidase)